MNTMTIQNTRCNHMLCGLNKHSATYRVEQATPHGSVIVTNCCAQSFEAMSVVIERPWNKGIYTVIKL